MMTTDIDSETPSSHPFSTITATTVTTTTATLKIAKRERITFLVAINKMTNAKAIAQIIPFVAEVKKALSDCIQPQNTPAVWIPDFSDSGADSVYLFKYCCHYW